MSENLLKFKNQIGTIDEFMIRFNPNIQKELMKRNAGHIECVTYNYPTMQQAAKIYGDEAISLWVKIQLEDLNNYCGVKEKMTAEQLKNLAEIMLYTYGEIKISELALFLLKFKAGKYGQFYGAIDPLVITNAMAEFMDDRMIAFKINERENEMIREQKKREEWKLNAITYEQHQELKNKQIEKL